MFKATATELNDCIQFEMTVLFPTIGKGNNWTFQGKDKKQSYRMYAKMCFDFLQISLDELQGQLQKIRPHYFDNSAMPCFTNDVIWPKKYWAFLELRRQCSKLIPSELRYAELVQKFDFEHLVPFYKLPQRETIQQLIKDIQTASSQILAAINLLRDMENNEPQKNEA